MADQNTVLQMVADPEFGKLTPADKRTALAAHDPEFGNLDDAGLQQFVSAHTSSSPNAGLSTGNKPIAVESLHDPLSGLNNAAQTVKNVATSEPVKETLSGAGAFLKRVTHFNPVEASQNLLGGGLTPESMVANYGSSEELKRDQPALYYSLVHGTNSPFPWGSEKPRPDLIAALDNGEFKNKRVNTVTGAVEDNKSTPLNVVNDIVSPIVDMQSFRERKFGRGIGNTLANLYGLVRAGRGYKASDETATNSARDATPEQASQLNDLRKADRIQETTAIAPDIRNAAARMAEESTTPPIVQRAVNTVTRKADTVLPDKYKVGKVNVTPPAQLSFGGTTAQESRTAAQQLPNAVQNAINEHESHVRKITEPYQKEVVSMKPAAAAVRASITPELQNAAARNPKVAATVTQLNELANELDSEASLGDVNAKRQRFNDELATEYDKADARQAESPVVTQAKKDAANALREIQYGTLSDLTGTDIRPLMKREGQLIEYKADVSKTLKQAGKGTNTVKPFAQRLKNSVRRFDRKNPGSSLLDLGKMIAGAREQTPLENFNEAASTALSNLGRYQPPEPILLASRPRPPQPATPLLLTGSVQSGKATPEFTYPEATRGDVLPAQQGRRVPPQLANVAIRGELPQQAGATPLPSTSDTSVIGNRQIEVPRSRTSPEDAVPQIVRQFAETHPFAESRIDVIHPDGTSGSIPASQLEEALRNNYRLANPLK